MAVVLYRVDERLIHGQVVVAWGHALRFDTIVVIDDDLAESDWEQDLYRIAAGEARAIFSSVDEAVQRVPEWVADDRRTLVLTRGLAAMRALGDAGLLNGAEVNLGGQHHGPDRRELLSYLHLTDADIEDVRALVSGGATVSARDVPDAARVSADQLTS